MAERVTLRRAAERLAYIAWRDIGLIAAFTVVLIGLAVLSEAVSGLGIVRALLGTVYVILVPGYCLVAALFPARDHIDGLERLGLSLGLGVSAVVILALGLDRLGLGFGGWPVMLITITATAVLSALTLWRRSRLPQYRQPAAAELIEGWLPRAEALLYAAMGGVLLLMLTLASWTFFAPSDDDYLTEFYILGTEGRAEAYPHTVRQGAQVPVTMVIANQERTTMAYRVEVWVIDAVSLSPSDRLTVLGPYVLQPQEHVSEEISWTMPVVGPDQRVDILLLRDGHPEPYRQLRLWINVVE